MYKVFDITDIIDSLSLFFIIQLTLIIEGHKRFNCKKDRQFCCRRCENTSSGRAW